MDIRLRDIEQTSKDIFLLNARLFKSPGPASYHADLIASIREAMQSLDRDLPYVETFVEDENDAALREEQKLTTRRLMEDLITHRIHYRSAVIQARTNLDKAEQEALLAIIAKTREEAPTTIAEEKELKDAKSARRTRRDENSSNSVLQASSDVTAELRRTHALMSEELSKSALSQELLTESSSTIAKLGEEYSSFSVVLSGSKRLLKELETADRADQLWIGGSFVFLALVSAYIVYKRILSRPVKAVIWTGSFMFSRLNRNKIVQNQASQGTRVAEVTETTTAVSPPPPPVYESPLDEVVDLILPDMSDPQDEASLIRKARVREGMESSDIIHAEL